MTRADATSTPPTSKISVVIPAFNAERTLERTLQSVRAQTYENLEIFVVDDGSRDSTRDVARDMAADDARITVLVQDNAGVATARNTALARATGDFISWIDSDDLWHPTKIERQLGVFGQANEPLAFVYTGYRLIDMADRILPNHRTLADVGGRTICKQIATNYFTNVSTVMAPTDRVRRCGGHDPGLRAQGAEGAEDLLLQLKLSLTGPVGRNPDALVGYRMHDENMSRDFERASRSNLQALAQIERDAPEIPAWVHRLGRARVVGYAGEMARRGNFLGALRLLVKLFAGQPPETAKMLAALFRHVVFDRGKAIEHDPEIGESFLSADPASLSWGPHMLLTARQIDRLDAADSQFFAGRSIAAEPKQSV